MLFLARETVCMVALYRVTLAWLELCSSHFSPFCGSGVCWPQDKCMQDLQGGNEAAARPTAPSANA